MKMLIHYFCEHRSSRHIKYLLRASFIRPTKHTKVQF